MREQAQFGEVGLRPAGLREKRSQMAGRVRSAGGFRGRGGQAEGDRPGWREGAKGRKEAQLRGWSSDPGG